MARARALAGCTIAQLAERFSLMAPADLRRHKGFVGALIERALGATAGSRAAPDFEALGIELKTLPVDGRGRALESTFVCTIPLTEIGEVEWLSSRVRRKLNRVLWIPVEGERQIAVLKKLASQKTRLGVKGSWARIPHPCGLLAWNGSVGKPHPYKRGHLCLSHFHVEACRDLRDIRR